MITPLIIILIIIILYLLRRLTVILISPKDTREPYFRNESGHAMAIKIHGEAGTLPSHEDFMHNGLPHQNPLVQTSTQTNFFRFWNPIIQIETRYYPITVNEELPMQFLIEDLQNSIIRMRDNRVNLIELTEEQEHEVYDIESQGQEKKGVEIFQPRTAV